MPIRPCKNKTGFHVYITKTRSKKVWLGWRETIEQAKELLQQAYLETQERKQGGDRS